MKQISDKFSQIHKRHLMWAIVKSGVCALSLGLFVTGVLLLAFKLGGIYLAAGYYALIGVGLAIFSGAAFYWWLFKPTQKQVAKRTDDEYGLDERVQTALAFSDREGTLIELQREDAKEKLDALPPRKFSFAKIWHFCLIGIVSLAIGLAGITVPASAETLYAKDPDSRPRQVTAEELAGVRELIADIENSALSENLKSSVGAALEQLLSELAVVNTEGTLKSAVDKAMDSAAAAILPTLTYRAIGAQLTAFDQAYLAQAVLNGGGVYQYHQLTVYDEVRMFDALKYDAASVKVGKGINPLRSSLAVTISGGLLTSLGAVGSAAARALSLAEVPENDGLYLVIESFAEGALKIRSDFQGKSDDAGAQSAIDDLFSSFVVDLTGEVSTQAYNAAVNVFVANRLKIIFGYLPIELPLIDPDSGEENNQGTDTPGPGNPGNPDGSGSDGSGKTEYGSDDEIWVPGRGYMKYGDVIDEYYALINQYLHSDELTDEQKNMIRTYYDLLFGSSGKN